MTTREDNRLNVSHFLVNRSNDYQFQVVPRYRGEAGVNEKDLSTSAMPFSLLTFEHQLKTAIAMSDLSSSLAVCQNLLRAYEDPERDERMLRLTAGNFLSSGV